MAVPALSVFRLTLVRATNDANQRSMGRHAPDKIASACRLTELSGHNRRSQIACSSVL
jgi:hypothetical protein